MSNVLASSLQGTRLELFDQGWEQRMAELPIEAVLVCIIDTVPVDALPWLAEQLNVLGYKGWELVNTEAERRQLLKDALLIHMYKGTPFGMKRAIQSVGFVGAEIQEGIGLIRNGAGRRNGVFSHGGGNWATFRVIFDLGNQKGITAQLGEILRFLVNEYKPASRVLTDIGFTATLEETLPVEPTETLAATATADFLETYTPALVHNGAARRNGSVRRDSKPESLNIDMTTSFMDEMPAVQVRRQGAARRNGQIKRDDQGQIPYGDLAMVITVTSPSGAISTVIAQ